MVLIELSGRPAVRIIELGKPDKGMRWLMIVDNTAYIVAYAASPPERFQDWLHTAQMIANSYSIYIRLGYSAAPRLPPDELGDCSCSPPSIDANLFDFNTWSNIVKSNIPDRSGCGLPLANSPRL